MTYLSVFQLGGGYLFGLPVGFVADSIGATVGAGAAFLLGRTVLFEPLCLSVIHIKFANFVFDYRIGPVCSFFCIL